MIRRLQNISIPQLEHLERGGESRGLSVCDGSLLNSLKSSKALIFKRAYFKKSMRNLKIFSIGTLLNIKLSAHYITSKCKPSQSHSLQSFLSSNSPQKRKSGCLRSLVSLDLLATLTYITNSL